MATVKHCFRAPVYLHFCSQNMICTL